MCRKHHHAPTSPVQTALPRPRKSPLVGEAWAQAWSPEPRPPGSRSLQAAGASRLQEPAGSRVEARAGLRVTLGRGWDNGFWFLCCFFIGYGNPGKV